jgi:hypothetical protein
MPVLNAWLTGIFVKWSQALRAREVDITPVIQEPVILRLVATRGYEVQIRSVQRVTRHRLVGFFLPFVVKRYLDLSAVVSHDAPEPLKRVCELQMTFAYFSPRFVAEHKYHKAAMNEYSTALLQHMQREAA